MYVLCLNIVLLLGHLTLVARLIELRKYSVSSLRELLVRGQYHMINVWMYSSSIHLNIIEYPMYYVIKFLTVKWTLIYQMFLSSILTRIRVVMLLSCTNSNVMSTVLSMTLLIVLLTCGTIYRKTWLLQQQYCYLTTVSLLLC